MQAHVDVAHDLGLNGGSIGQPQDLSHNKFLIPRSPLNPEWRLPPSPLSLLARAFRFSAAVLLLYRVFRCCCRSSTCPHSLISGRKKKRRRRRKKTDEEGSRRRLEQKLDPEWRAFVSIRLIFSLLQAARRLFCTDASASKEIKVTELRSERSHRARGARILDRKWFRWNSHTAADRIDAENSIVYSCDLVAATFRKRQKVRWPGIIRTVTRSCIKRIDTFF